jgi:serine/threonine protein kinase
MIARASAAELFHVKILDFGLAKYLDVPQPQSIDHFNSLMGSIHYMAPEQFQRLPIDHRTDLYSLGCIFYEAVTGHPAFDGENVSELIDAHLKKTPFPMKQLRRDISPRLERWIIRLLEKNPPPTPCARCPRSRNAATIRSEPPAVSFASRPDACPSRPRRRRNLRAAGDAVTTGAESSGRRKSTR